MSTRPKWYATRCRLYERRESPETIRQTDEEDVWTVGPRSDCENWNTDGSYPGYGMNKADAERVAELWNRTRGVDDLSAIGREP